jgi:competence protein ComEA
VPSFSLTRGQALAVAALALVVVFVAARYLGGGAAAGSSPASQVGAGSTSSIPELTTPGAAPGPSAGPSVGSSVLVIDVAGAVRRPGLYRLPPGSRIADAIARAGGLSRKADGSLVNLAAPVSDGEQVLVPTRLAAGPAAAGSSPAGPAAGPTAPVDLNTATAEQLDALPGVGPVTAQKIIDYRTQHGPFTSVDDLDAIPGIGPARIADLRGLVIP